MTEKVEFETILQKHEKLEATGIHIPFDVNEVFGAKRVPVKVWINGVEHLSTIVRMGGKYLVTVPKVFREAAKIKAGDKIKVVIQKDTEKRTVEIPQDLAEALENNTLTEFFLKMSYTHQKEYVRAIEEAKKSETRLKRIEKTIEMLKKK